MTAFSAGHRAGAPYRSHGTNPVVTVVVMLLSGLAALAVQEPCFRLRHAFDDYYFWYLLGMWRTGRLATFAWLLHPMSGRHLLPAWHATYAAHWACFGMNPWPWHAVALAAHLVGAFSLFVLAKRHLGGTLGPASAAIFWSGAAIGGWDNPHAWLATGCLAYGWTCLLVALACTTRAATSNGAAGGMLLFLWLALLYWGALFSVAWCVPLHFWLYERGASPARRTRLLLALTAAPILLSAAAVAALVLFSGANAALGATLAPSAPWWTPLLRTVGQFTAALATLTAWGTLPPAEESWPAKSLLACVLLGITLTSAGARRRWLIVFLLPFVLYLVLVNWSRRDVSLEAALTWGRYLYAPTLAWCMIVATLVAAWEARLQRTGQALMALITLLAVGVLVMHERQVARVARDTLTALAAPQWQLVDMQRDLLRECSAAILTSKPSTISRLEHLPDLPVRLPYVQGVLCPLSVWQSLLEPDAAPRISIVRWDELAESDAQAWLAALNRSDSPLAPEWRQATADCRATQQQLQWLVHEARQQNRLAYLPEVLLPLAGTQVPLSQWISTMTRNTSTWVRVPTSQAALLPEQLESTQTLLCDQAAPEALEWQRWFEEIAQGRPVRGLFVP